jgi:hypothetical protein
MARKPANKAVSDTPNQPPVIAPRAAKLSRKGPELTPAEFWRVTKEYPRGAATQYALYRKYPVIDRLRSGESKASIDEKPEMDEAYILKTWGTGRYTVYFNDYNVRPSCIANTVLKFDLDWDNPPNLNQAEVTEVPDNKGYIEQLKLRGLWKREQENEMAENGAAAAAVQAMENLSKVVITEAQKPKAADVVERSLLDVQTAGFKKIVESVAEAKPAAGGGMDNPLVVELMRQNHELHLELAKSRNNPAPAGSLGSQLKDIREVLHFSREVSPQEESGGFAERLLLSLATAAGPLLARLFSAPAAPVAPGPVPASAVPVVNPEIDPAALEAMAQQTGLDVKTLAAFIRIGKKAISAYRDGYPGNAFAQMVEATEGEEMAANLFAIGKDGVLDALRKAAPMLGPAAPVVQSAAFEAWLNDFMEYGAIEDEPEAPPAGSDTKGAAA